MQVKIPGKIEPANWAYVTADSTKQLAQSISRDTTRKLAGIPVKKKDKSVTRKKENQEVTFGPAYK